MMKVLFISSGNSSSGISPIIKNQGESLKKVGINIYYFTIKGKGFKGYIKNVKPLRKYLKNNKFDVIHAHYSMSAFVASLAGAKPLVVSLMGSDVKSEKYFKLLIKIFSKYSWSKVIVKSIDMKKSIGIANTSVIPNGVDLNKFKPINKVISSKKTAWNSEKKHILFAANPQRLEKNLKLTLEALELINDDNIELHYLNDIANDQVPYYHNSSDLVLLSSLWEGSPNVIKEAMACNIPIVSTDVGDVKWLLNGLGGCFVSSFEAKEFAANIVKALKFSDKYSKTKGRQQIIELGLDSEQVSNELVGLYDNIRIKTKS